MISNFYLLAIVCIFLLNASEETDTPVANNDIHLNFEISENEKQLVENEMIIEQEELMKNEREETDELKLIREMSLKRFAKTIDEVKLENDQSVENAELKLNSDQFSENEMTLSIEEEGPKRNGLEEADEIREKYQWIREISLKRFAKAIDEVQLECDQYIENAELKLKNDHQYAENADLKLKSCQSVENERSHDEQKVEIQECYICNEEVNEKFQFCEHLDHATCLICAQKWIEKNGQDSSCPLCRNEFDGGSNSPRIQNNNSDFVLDLPEIFLNLSREEMQVGNAYAFSESLNRRVIRDREEMEVNNAIRESLNPIRENRSIREIPRLNFVPAPHLCFQCKIEPATCKKTSGDVYGLCESCVISQIVEDENLGRENNNLNRPRRKPSICRRIFCCCKTKPANQKKRLNKM